jgi:hypothetical protein
MAGTASLKSCITRERSDRLNERIIIVSIKFNFTNKRKIVGYEMSEYLVIALIYQQANLVYL